MRIAFRMLSSAGVGLLLFGVLIFGPAGTFRYWQGWTFILVFTICTNAIGLYLARTDPALLERRLKIGPGAETRAAQKAIISLAFLSFVALFVISALDYRLGWSKMPASVSIVGDILVVLGLVIDLRVFRENSYGASTVEIAEGQTVISTGPYALVRHPMYVGVLITVLGMPLALGSYWGLVFMFVNVPILVLRIRDEEAMLQQELDGYVDYMRHVRYRLLPGLW
jgi:protein-S-isoprenylcysteine O-methyltransferase Ste14